MESIRRKVLSFDLPPEDNSDSNLTGGGNNSHGKVDLMGSEGAPETLSNTNNNTSDSSDPNNIANTNDDEDNDLQIEQIE
jgi:hypothetical protein